MNTQKMSVPDVRCTAYISNLPYDLTNIDVQKLCARHGKIIKVTILRDKVTRKSKGVAFVLFSTEQDAQDCCNAWDGKEMFGRTLKASIAKDNGKSAEHGQRKHYPDKSRCFECGTEGHMSYSCPRNVLGSKSPPRKGSGRGKRKQNVGSDTVGHEIEPEDAPVPNVDVEEGTKATKRVKYRKSNYFSDDEELDDE